MPRPTELLRFGFLGLLPAALSAQGRQIEFHLGRWDGDNPAVTYELRTTTRLGGVFTHGIGVTALVSDTLGRRRAFYGAGYEIQALRRRRSLEAYALAGVALGRVDRHVERRGGRAVEPGRRRRMAAGARVRART